MGLTSPDRVKGQTLGGRHRRLPSARRSLLPVKDRSGMSGSYLRFVARAEHIVDG